jgi:hypothetical protein
MTVLLPRLRALGALALVFSVALAACGSDDDGTTSTSDTTGSGSGGSSSAAGDLVVQVTVGGGFVTPTTALATVPQVTVLSDGTVLTPGIVPLIYPGPAITPIQSGTAEAAAIDDLVEQAGTLGLLDGPLDFGSPGISDAPTTTVTIVADGVEHRQAAYALSFGDVEGAGDAGLDETQIAHRKALSDFVAATQAIAVGDAVWTPTAIVVTVVGPATTDPAAPSEPAVEWPLATAPATAGDFPCTVVEGADADTLAAALATANELTGWVVDGETYSVAFRPVVPGDPGCP